MPAVCRWQPRCIPSLGKSSYPRSNLIFTEADNIKLLEEFDAIGRYREIEKDQPVDAAGSYVTQSGDDRIYDADVYTNTSQPLYSSGEPSCSGEYDINGIMAHEVGHVIGIGHSNVSGATMYPSVSACNTGNRTLASDDFAARDNLY